MLEDSVNRILSEWVTPECDGDRCVHALSTVASCRACVDACPRDAWLLDDDGLGLDTEACDGCALCVPACPEEALSLPRDLALRRSAEGIETAFAICREIGTASDEGVVPCLHAIGLRDIARLHASGIRELVVAEAPCADCACGSGPSLKEAADDFATLAADRGLPTVVCTSLAPVEWRKLIAERDLPGGSPAVSRRRLFSMISRSAGLSSSGETADAGTEKSPPASPDRRGEVTPPDGETSPYLFVYVPEIDGAACNGCEACIRLCPHKALIAEDDDDGARFVVRAERCSGCNLCVDVCDQDAVAVRRMARVSRPSLDLVMRKCPSCGAPYREPAEREAREPLCRVCTTINHRRNLYQVLK